MAAETRDLELSEVFDALVSAGATVYEWCEGGVATGCQVVMVGQAKCITLSDSEGYKLDDTADYEDTWELVDAADYEEDSAQRAASDLDGYFGIVGVPGSTHHSFEWFGEEDEAREWVGKRAAETLEANPVLGLIENRVVPTADVFDATYRDGNRVYFRPREVGSGFVPKGVEIA